MLRLLAHLARALLLTTWRRARGERVRARWTFSFEAMVELLRSYSAWLATLDPARLRRAASSLGKALPRSIQKQTASPSGVPVTTFTPPQAADSAILFVHGGGYVFGSAEQAQGLIAELALRTRRRVIAPDYRLAPEYPYPAALEDLEAVYGELISRASASTPPAIIGESAGAGLALALLQRLRAAQRPLPPCAVLLSPLVNLSADSASWRDNQGIDWGDPRYILEWNRMYAAKLALDDPRVSPLRSDCAGLPPLLVIAGDSELLVDDARALVDQVHAAAGSARLVLGADMVHGYVAFGAATPRAEEALRAISEFIGEPRASKP